MLYINADEPGWPSKQKDMIPAVSHKSSYTHMGSASGVLLLLIEGTGWVGGRGKGE